jgi:hypothetical protein
VGTPPPILAEDSGTAGNESCYGHVVKNSQNFYRFFTEFHFWKLNRVSEKSVKKLNKVKFQGFFMDFQIALFFAHFREERSRGKRVTRIWSDTLGFSRMAWELLKSP